MEEVFRRRALVSGAVSGVVAMLGLLVTRDVSPQLWHGHAQHEPGRSPLLSAVGGVASLWTVARRRYRLARVAAAVAVASVVAGWGVAQWPYLIVPDMTVADAAAPANALRPIAVGFAIGGALVAPSLFLLFRVFKGSGARAARRRTTEAAEHIRGDRPDAVVRSRGYEITFQTPYDGKVVVLGKATRAF